MATTAQEQFDKYALYTATVQSPATLARMLDHFYRDARGGAAPRTLREDFCGSFANSCAWVRLGPDRRAVAVDLDAEPLGYGCTHNRANLKLTEQLRVRVIPENVLTPDLPTADVIAAMNFSYWIFKTRAELLAYVRNCARTLEPGGVLVLDYMGGPDLRKSKEESREYDGFTYFFEQEGFDPVTHEAVFHIHFQRDGEEKRLRVFTYDWRIWTVPELREVLLEAGFAAVRTYWQGTTPEGEPDGTWYVADRVVKKQRPQWITYVVGLR